MNCSTSSYFGTEKFQHSSMFLTCGPIHNAASTGWQCTGMTPTTKDSSYTHIVLVSANMRQCYLKTKTGTPLTSECHFLLSSRQAV